MVGLSAALTAGNAVWPHPLPPIVVPIHTTTSYTSLIFTPVASVDAFVSQIAEIYAALSEGQEPLGPEFEAIWDANVAYLYES